jgi:hypothetical protein
MTVNVLESRPEPVAFMEFKYSIYHVSKIIHYAWSNDMDLIKTFDLAWSEVFPDLERNHAGFVLSLVDKVIKIMKIEGRQPEMVWGRIVFEKTKGI